MVMVTVMVMVIAVNHSLFPSLAWSAKPGKKQRDNPVGAGSLTFNRGQFRASAPCRVGVKGAGGAVAEDAE
jgi:hypothetical protein